VAESLEASSVKVRRANAYGTSSGASDCLGLRTVRERFGHGLVRRLMAGSFRCAYLAVRKYPAEPTLLLVGCAEGRAHGADIFRNVRIA
jgi:hypothetical protein